MSGIYGNVVGGAGSPNSYKIIGEDGTVLVAVATPSGNEELLTATENDVRKGKVFASDHGVATGAKKIPEYYTSTGRRLILPNNIFTISLETDDLWDYSSLQCIIAPFSLDGVAADRVVVDDCVYNTGDIDKVSNVTKNIVTKSIDLNIINSSNTTYIIYFFTYKEEL